MQLTAATERIRDAFAAALHNEELGDGRGLPGSFVFIAEYLDDDGDACVVMLKSDPTRLPTVLGLLDFAREIHLRDALAGSFDD